MLDRLARWSGRRLLGVWGIGLAIEALLILAMFVLLVRPDPPLVAALRGESLDGSMTVTIVASDDSLAAIRPRAVAPPAAEDSFETVLHWPLHRPLLEGGGRVIAMPMRLWWVPVLYVGAVPLLLLALTFAWLLARRPGDSQGV